MSILKYCIYCKYLLFVDDSSAEGSDESTVDRSYVKKKLEHGLTRIWQVRSVLIYLLLSFFLSLFSIPPLASWLALPPHVLLFLPPGRPIESESLFAGNRHVQLQVRRLHCGSGCYQQVGTHFLISANWIGLQGPTVPLPPLPPITSASWETPLKRNRGRGHQWNRLFLNKRPWSSPLTELN